jgi:hypothetical protein
LVRHQVSQEATAARLRFQVAGAPQFGERGADLGVGDLDQRPVAAEQGDGAADGRGVGAVGVGLAVRRAGRKASAAAERVTCPPRSAVIFGAALMPAAGRRSSHRSGRCTG